MKRIVLVQPSGPRNVGMIARIAANFGPCELWLVAPERASLLIHPEFEQMSHGVPDAAAGIRVVDELEEALADCTASVGFTARVRGHRVRSDWRELAPDLTEPGDSADERLALVFGNEIVGLESRHTDLCGELCHIRVAPEHTSLNLAVSVGIVLSGLYTGRSAHKHEPGGHMLTGQGREYLKANLKHVFAEKVARSASAAEDIRASIERVFSRVPLENRDARAWHLMLRALGSTKTPADFGLDPTPKAARRNEVLEKARDRRRGESPRDGDTGEA